MRRADRLFQIIQVLRRSSRPVTAAALAGELEVSKRTVYRDIADLIGQRVPIQGEAGLGYLIAADYDMPPLMLTVDELEAAVLGAQWVARHADPVLAQAASDLVAKIMSAVPERLRPYIAEPSVGVRPAPVLPQEVMDLSRLRAAIRAGQKLDIRYRSEGGEMTERTVWPVILGYAEAHRILVAWCELREDFRHFRIDRIVDAHFLESRHGLRRGELRRRWIGWREKRLAEERTVPSSAIPTRSCRGAST